MFADKQPRPSNDGTSGIQRKLEVGVKDDPQEKEADAVADAVMRMSESQDSANGSDMKLQQESHIARLLRRYPDAPKAPSVKRAPGTPGPASPIHRKKEEKENSILKAPEPGFISRMHDADEETVQKKEDEESVMKMDESGKGGTAPADFEQGIQSSKGQGSPLPENVQQDIGPKMGADLSDVRVHTGSKAHKMSTAINAKAFTHGQDIYFKNGNYDPSGNAGKKLLTHELAHTQQQKGNVNRKVQRNWLWERMKGQAKKSLRVLPNWLQFYIAFNIGISVGIIEWVKDLLVLAWNTNLIKIVYDLIWGDLIQDMKDMGKMLKELTWDQFKEIMSEIGRQIVGDVEAYWARMTSSDPQTSGYAWGWIVGYLVPEVVLLIITDGIATGAKWGAKVLQWLGRLGAKILKYGSKGVKLARKGVTKAWRGVKKGLKKGWQGVKKNKKGFVGNLAKHPLRIKYENEVKALKKIGEDLLLKGESEEKVARTLHQMRRDLGVKYKDATPAELREYIYRMNKMDYGDELGPDIDYLKNVRNKSWKEIIESASKPGGRFNRQYLLDKFPNEHNKLIPILDKYEIL